MALNARRLGTAPATLAGARVLRAAPNATYGYLFALLVQRMDAGTLTMFCPQAELAKDAKCSERTVRKVMRYLRSNALLVLVSRGNQHNQKCSVYCLGPTVLAGVAAAVKPGAGAKRRAQAPIRAGADKGAPAQNALSTGTGASEHRHQLVPPINPIQQPK